VFPHGSGIKRKITQDEQSIEVSPSSSLKKLFSDIKIYLNSIDGGNRNNKVKKFEKLSNIAIDSLIDPSFPEYSHNAQILLEKLKWVKGILNYDPDLSRINKCKLSIFEIFAIFLASIFHVKLIFSFVHISCLKKLYCSRRC
jgi:hypothetical protein